MRETMLCLYRVPKESWEVQADPFKDISPFVEDALAIERRIPKGVNLANERTRYHLCCRRIQEALFYMKMDLDMMSLGEDYLRFLRYLYRKDPKGITSSRVSACFFQPVDVEAHWKSFHRLMETHGCLENKQVLRRLQFFRQAADQGDGVIEILDFHSSEGFESKAGDRQTEFSFSENLQAIRNEATDELSEEEEKEALNILKKQIQSALATGGSVNFSNHPHMIITEALKAFVFKENPQEVEGAVRVIYMDGSEAEPFPVRCLNLSSGINEKEGIPLLKASLISMRHLQMDEEVDFAWFRNSKVSTSRPFAETDAYCTERTVELLKGFKGAIHLQVFQTGLEPAVVGFYRGLVEFLRDQQFETDHSRLRVIPFYFKGETKGYEEGSPWESFS